MHYPNIDVIIWRHQLTKSGQKYPVVQYFSLTESLPCLCLKLHWNWVRDNWVIKKTVRFVFLWNTVYKEAEWHYTISEFEIPCNVSVTEEQWHTSIDMLDELKTDRCGGGTRRPCRATRPNSSSSFCKRPVGQSKNSCEKTSKSFRGIKLWFRHLATS